MSIRYYILIHLILSLMATNSILQSIDEGKISEKMKEKVANTQITLLQIARGNAENAQAFFIILMFLSNFILFAYVSRILNLLKPTKNDSK